jgi:hypothetical protein
MEGTVLRTVRKYNFNIYNDNNFDDSFIHNRARKFILFEKKTTSTAHRRELYEEKEEKSVMDEELKEISMKPE